MTNFDPYHKWLGIPPEEQPPNHYRLLGLRVFENDPDVIENAAEGKMLLLRTRQTGPNAAACQRLLNEVAAASHCLLNRERRDRYNSELRSASDERRLLQSPTIPRPPEVLPSPPVPTYDDWTSDRTDFQDESNAMVSALVDGAKRPPITSVRDIEFTPETDADLRSEMLRLEGNRPDMVRAFMRMNGVDRETALRLIAERKLGERKGRTTAFPKLKNRASRKRKPAKRKRRRKR